MKITTLIWFLLLLHTYNSSPIPLPGDAITYRSQPSIGRYLLQAKKPCSVNFEAMNYTIITSRCKGPNYPANLCCQALKEFACPYANELNDLSNDCSTIMFSYINLYGNYPPGVFSSLCHGDDLGLVCDSVPPVPEVGPGRTNDGWIVCNLLLHLVITVVLQVLLSW
ncbi:hypothetical protein QVD17_27110 [Tagetes erecta]|uniref:GPI-anchored protein LLG1-like domain-containing protein n=1 Tax=Tagetes erecta TaxID=13708 RepID=A0AAD8K8K3_TARER|nr:hypothetical protein QVD17_27110 [Tagetes erecta]